MKISILMPTYNDANTITQTLESVVNQTYDNWELIIVDDGSTDNTKQVIQDFISSHNLSHKIQYHYQTNADQLNALQTALQHVTGDFIYILHSDDLLYDNKSLERFVAFHRENPNYEVYTGNYMIIDGSGNETGNYKLLKYKRTPRRLALLYLWLGRNLYHDSAFFRKDIMESYVRTTYLTWNMPYWIKLQERPEVLNVINMDFNMFRYRVYEDNYINNEIGKLNVINGELRVVTRLMQFFTIPCYSLQYFIFRCINKLKLTPIYTPVYFNKEEKNKGKIVEFVIKKRYAEEYKNNLFLSSLVAFYKNPQKRAIRFEKLPEDIMIFKGADMRKFNTLLLKGELPEIYYQLMNEMKQGFDEIQCDKKDVAAFENIMQFFCIYPFVKLTIGG